MLRLERATQIILPPDTKKLRLLTTKPSSLHVEHAEVADSVMTRAYLPSRPAQALAQGLPTEGTSVPARSPDTE